MIYYYCYIKIIFNSKIKSNLYLIVLVNRMNYNKNKTFNKNNNL